MPGIAFGRRKAALGVHRADVEEFRHLDALDERAVTDERFQRALEGLGHSLIEIVERDRGRHREPHALDRARPQRVIGSSASTASSMAQQPTDARQRPELSSENDSGTPPSSGTRRCVGL